MLFKTLTLAVLSVSAISIGSVAYAEEASPAQAIPHEHAEMYHQVMEKVDKAKNLYQNVMAKMHKSMAEVETTGDADIDFVKGMIPHHQGAIDMAQVLLEKGKDPELKKLAEGIIKAQEAEIKMMNEWLKANEKK